MRRFQAERPRGRPKTTNAAEPPEKKIEYLSVDASAYGGAWYESTLVETHTKLIAGLSVPYYVVTLPNGDTASVERWHFRDATRSKLLSDMKETLVPGTRVEVMIRPEGTFTPTSLIAWALAEVVRDYGPDHSVEVKFQNSDFWKPATYPRNEVRLSTDVEATRLAWNPPRTIVSDREHLIQHKLQTAAELVLQLEGLIDRLDGHTFEPHRDTLIEIVEDLLIARYYDKAMVLIRFLKDMEALIAKRKAAQ